MIEDKLKLEMLKLNKERIGALKSLLHEFKEFALRGNAVDLAIGVVIGGAFGMVVKSLVDDIIMPPLGFLTGGLDFKDKMIVLKPGPDAAHPASAIHYGMFLNQVINLLIVAAAIFSVIKLMNVLYHKPAPPPTPAEPAEPPMTTDQKLLGEIRDLLKARAEGQKP